MSDRNNNTTTMAPDGHSADIGRAGSVVHDLIAGMTITSGLTRGHTAPPHRQSSSMDRAYVSASPLPNGILHKGEKVRKRVSFRDRQLVDIREIPPRSSPADEYSEEDDDDDDVDGSSGSDEAASSSESEEEGEKEEKELGAVAEPQPAPLRGAPFVNGNGDKPVSVSVTKAAPSSSLPVSSFLTVTKAPSSFTPTTPTTPTTLVSTRNARPERTPIPWTPVSSFTAGSAKGSYNGPVSPATRVVSLMSRIISGVSSSPAGVTGVTSSAARTHIRPRSATAASSSASSLSSSSSSASASASPASRKATSPVPPKKPPTVVRVEKKVKKITPTLDNVMTSQTVRSVQKYGVVSEALHKGGGSSSNTSSSNSTSTKSGRKKRALQRRQEGSEKRKATSSRRNSSKDSKQSSGSSSGSGNSNNSKTRGDSPAWANKSTVHAKRSISSAGAARPRAKSAAANGLGHVVRDSLSLPPLSGGGDDNNATPLPHPPSGNNKRLPQQQQQQQHQQQHRLLARTTPSSASTTVYTMDGFIFPGDPAHDLIAAASAGLRPGTEDVQLLKPHGGVTPAATQIGSLSFSSAAGVRDQGGAAAGVRDQRASSAPPPGSGSAASSRRKRFYAWQMANGNLQNSLHEPPSITPMWETMTPSPATSTITTAPKPSYYVGADR